MDEHLKFDACTKALADSGGRALGAIISKFRTLKNVGLKTFESMYNAGVKPIIEYGSGIWGHLEASPINAVQNRAMRYYLGVHKLSPNIALSGDMGWITPKLSRVVNRLRLWNRLVEMQGNRLTRKIFEWDYSIAKQNWSSEMKKFFSSLDSECFSNKSVFDLTLVNDILLRRMNEYWKVEVRKKPKLRTYRLFKSDCFQDEYVQKISQRRERSLFTQFRHGILPLKIETGRFKKLEIAQRTCELCNLGCTEDETHFLCSCPTYNDIRSPLFEKARNLDISFDDFNDSEKLVYLIKNFCKEVSVYVSKAWNIRQNRLYN